ncbi:MAG TPA: hypothetical protein VGO75_16145 [Gemmatimonadaceae bacterium]|nr:hypothetical protein [Gemmatimonadaceae bacterium]
MRALSIAILSIVSASTSVSGQSSSGASAPTPCVTDAERHRFDFWIGEWSVTTSDGKPQGSSVIQSVSGGCALLENWTSARGGNGKSLNAYNPQIRQWQQYWIGQDGLVTEYRTSQFDGRSITFFERRDAKPDSVGRLTFTPVDNATVRQHAEASSDGGKSWTTTYDLYYHRK